MISQALVCYVLIEPVHVEKRNASRTNEVVSLFFPYPRRNVPQAKTVFPVKFNGAYSSVG
jgi:hypothetical protein